MICCLMDSNPGTTKWYCVKITENASFKETFWIENIQKSLLIKAFKPNL